MKKLLFFVAINVSLWSDTLETIVVEESKDSSTTIGSSKITEDNMKHYLQGNGDIASVLKTNPNIKTEDKNTSIESISDITPSKIEINGGKFYQNTFLIDGASNDSALDPAYSDKFATQDVPGNENAMFIDLELIEEITVYDSAIPAKYGNFNGGVIDAKTKRAGSKPESKISFKTTNDSLVNIQKKQISSADDASNVSSLKDLNYKKNLFSIYHSQPINDSNSILGTYSFKNSITPKRTFDYFKDEKQESHNAMIKYSHYLEDDSILDITGTYSSFSNDLIRTDVKDSDFTNITRGFNLKANYEKNFNFWALESVLAIGRSENSRINSQKDFKKWRKAGSKNWGLDKTSGNQYSVEGGFGNIEKYEDNINFNTDLTSNKFLLGDFSNKLNTGFQFKFAQSNFKRNEDTYVYDEADLNTNVICNGSTSDCEDGVQYFSSRKVYKAEDVDANITSLGTYIDNTIKYKNFEITPGIRLDYNTFLKNYDLAPRINTSYDFFGDGNTKVFAGLNRYYDKAFLGFKLREARSPYQTEYRSTYLNEVNSNKIPAGQLNPTVWNPSADKGDNIYTYTGLDTPYSDEQLLSFKQNIKNNTFLVKYIIRKGKNQFREDKGDFTLYTRPDGNLAYYKPINMTNAGESKYNALTVSIFNNKSMKLGSYDFSYNLSTNINTVNNSNFTNYNFEDKTISNEKVSLDGKVIDINDLGLNQPKQTYNLLLALENIKTDIFGIGTNLSIYNFIKYIDDYKAIIDTKQTKTIPDPTPNEPNHTSDAAVFETKKYKGYFTFDTKLAMDFNLSKKQTLTTTMEIVNLFDKKIEENIDKQYYNIGRQFWFQVAYKF